MKRIAVFLAPLLLVSAGVLSAQAQTTGSPQAEATDAPKPAEPSRGLDQLFERLAKATAPDEAKGIANLIERRWQRSGSDTADLLMARALTVMQKNAQDLPLAIELLDRVIFLEPKWAEAWNKRATAFYMLGDNQRAMLDVREALVREPRHFGALSGMGILLEAAGDKKGALEVFRKVIEIHPYLGNVKETIEKLIPDAEGRDI